MSNHFPTVPSTWNILEIHYTPYLTNPSGYNVTSLAVTDAPFYLADTSSGLFTSQGGNSGGLINLDYVFATPGTAGDFDQDTIESLLATILDDLSQAMVDANSVSLATAQSYITVQRVWLFTDMSTNWKLTFNDTMTYPVV